MYHNTLSVNETQESRTIVEHQLMLGDINLILIERRFYE